MSDVANVLQIVGFSVGALAGAARLTEWRLKAIVARAVEDALKDR